MKLINNEKQAGTKRRKRRLPAQFICIAPAEASLVFDWLKGAGSESENETAEIHLRLCFHCQEAVLSLMRLNREFRENVRRFLHSADSKDGIQVTIQFAKAAAEHEPAQGDRNGEKTLQSLKVGGVH